MEQVLCSSQDTPLLRLFILKMQGLGFELCGCKTGGRESNEVKMQPWQAGGECDIKLPVVPSHKWLNEDLFMFWMDV